MTDTPDISVVVCTRNRAGRLPRMVERMFAAMSESAFDVELVLVDNGSTDETPQVVRQLSQNRDDVIACREVRAGLGNARNTGVSATSGRVVLFTDDDVYVSAGWIDALANPLLSGAADGVMGPVGAPDHYSLAGIDPFVLAMVAYCPAVEDKPYRLLGANMGAVRSVFREVSFDPDLGSIEHPGWEDMLFSYQLIERGYRLLGVPAAVVEHHFGMDRLTRASLTRQVRGYGRGDAYLRHHWHHDRQRLQIVRVVKAGVEVAVARSRRRMPVDQYLQSEWQYSMHRELFRLRKQPIRYVR